MHDFLKRNYGFSDFQIAQLKFIFKTVTAEVSKFIIMAIIFRDKLWLYLFTIILLLLLRTSAGGFHCKTYLTCFLFSVGYMYLCIEVLPVITVNKFFQLVSLFICMLLNYYIGPVLSTVRKPINKETTQKMRKRTLFTLFFYLTLTYILPTNPYMASGFWIVILHTTQLIVAKLLKKMKKESKSITTTLQATEKFEPNTNSIQPAI